MVRMGRQESEHPLDDGFLCFRSRRFPARQGCRPSLAPRSFLFQHQFIPYRFSSKQHYFDSCHCDFPAGQQPIYHLTMSIAVPTAPVQAFAARHSAPAPAGQHPSDVDGIQWEQILRGQGFGLSASDVANRKASNHQRPAYRRPTADADVVRRKLEALAARQDTTAIPTTTIDPTSSGESRLPTSATDIGGQPSATTSADNTDLLAIMPSFAFSMPAQIVVFGINIALTTVLAIHLLFTVHYHYPLSRANWLLQVSSSIILLVMFCVGLNFLLADLMKQSHSWPFMFDYLAEELPPSNDGDWSMVKTVMYLLLRAITTVIIHVTHIQFLTLLFPSALEARLILWMLGPLALVAAGMEFTWLSPEDDVKTSDLGDAINNICNSTLTLLYSCGLLTWGGLVNRRRAWRADGGTAAFGGGAMGLAAMNVVMSFVQIRYDRLWWLPDICWTLTIWQSWLGFWWWVGSGMGIGEVEDRAEREARRKRKREKLKRRLKKEERQRLRAESAGNGVAVAEEAASEVMNGIKRLTQKITGAEGGSQQGGSTLSRRLRRTGQGPVVDEVELREVTAHQGDQAAQPEQADGQTDQDLTGIQVVDHEAVGQDGRSTSGDGTHSGSSDTNPTSSGITAPATGAAAWLARIGDMAQRHQPAFVRDRMLRLKLAHAAAARRAATEQTVVRDQVMNSNRTPGLRGMMRDAEVSSRKENTLGGSRRSSKALEESSKYDDRRSSTRRPSQATNASSRVRSASKDGHGAGAGRSQAPVLPPLTSIDGPIDGAGATTSSDPDSSTFASLSRYDSGVSPSSSTAAPAPVSPGMADRRDPFLTPSLHRTPSTGPLSIRPSSSPGPPEEPRADNTSIRARTSQDDALRDSDDGEWVEEPEMAPAAAPDRAASATHDDDDETEGQSTVRAESTVRAAAQRHGQAEEEGSEGEAGGSSSWTWRGGLRKARLQDRQVFE